MKRCYAIKEVLDYLLILKEEVSEVNQNEYYFSEKTNSIYRLKVRTMFLPNKIIAHLPKGKNPYLEKIQLLPKIDKAIIKKWTDMDIIEAVQIARQKPKYDATEIVAMLTDYPVAFKPIYKFNLEQENEIKTIDNKGMKEWVGKYVFSSNRNKI
jgi:hypothetical protein